MFFRHLALVLAALALARGEETVTLISPRYLDGGRAVELREGERPILCYHHGATRAPEGIDPAHGRGDYIHPLYGPEGEVLTDDYPEDHPHHRAVNWSWATLQWKGETRDLFAVRGIWARPAGRPDFRSGPMFAELTAQSRWMWDDAIPVVAEHVSIRAYREEGGSRCIDIEIRIEALVDGLEFAGRLEAGYSGFNVRMAPGEGQEIVFHTDGPDAEPRRAWADYSAVFPGGGARAGVSIVQAESNPMYPQDWRKYDSLNFFQPLYPGGELIAMPKGEAVTLRYRLWIHPGRADEQRMADAWAAYNRPHETTAEHPEPQSE